MTDIRPVQHIRNVYQQEHLTMCPERIEASKI